MNTGDWIFVGVMIVGIIGPIAAGVYHSCRETCGECGKRLLDRGGRRGRIAFCPDCGHRRRLTRTSVHAGVHTGPPRPIPKCRPPPWHVNGFDCGYQPSRDCDDERPVDLSRLNVPSGDTAIVPPSLIEPSRTVVW